jgi:hypothetical protein
MNAVCEVGEKMRSLQRLMTTYDSCIWDIPARAHLLKANFTSGIAIPVKPLTHSFLDDVIIFNLLVLRRFLKGNDTLECDRSMAR